MASPEVLNVARLLTPIPGESPAGPDLRADPSPVSEYHTIRGARKAASDAERKQDQGDDSGGPADWRKVLDRCAEALAEKSKDLELAAYLVEAAVRVHGFAGLRDGFKVARGLVEIFWEGLHPDAADDPDVETRFSHVLWLSGIDKPGTLIAPVRKTPFTASTGAGRFSLTQYHQQISLSQSQVADANLRKRKLEEGAALLDSIQRAVAETPPKFYADLMDDAAAGEAEFRAFCKALEEKSGYEAPDTDLRAVLESYLDVVRVLARDKIPKAVVAPAAAASAPPAGGDGAEAAATAAAPVVDPAVIRDRGDALERLEKVAAFFRQHEPQSVLPYALEQVVHWGRMPLPDLLSELIPDDAPRKTLFKQLGIKVAEAKK